jgi:iron complex transport system substrate-binding protein
VDFNGADNLLALGVQPVTIRDWYGDQPRAVWPWADALLGETPTILSSGPLDIEAIAAAEPDVILALYSGITAEEHARLSAIAPVVAVPEGVGDYELPWDRQALIAGRAIGREAEAEAQVQAIRDRLDAAAAAHPDWAGRTVTLGTVWEGNPWVYTASDPRVQLLGQLGLVSNPAVEALSAPGTFSVELSAEATGPFDADLLLWFADEGMGPIEDLALRGALPGVAEGREAFLGPQVTSALSHTSLLSLPYALDALEPLLAAALDGDPATVAEPTE